MKCPYCSAPPSHGRCTTTSSGRHISECTSCGRVIHERQTQPHHFFHLQAQDSPLFLSTSDLPLSPPQPPQPDPDDPFHHSGFITAFSTWSLRHSPLFSVSSLSFSGHLAELERALEGTSVNSSSSSSSSSSAVVVDNLRAYLQIVDVASILGLDHDISDHAFQLFRDCSSATCLRNRSVEALATACLVQAIREAQEPRTLQEISIAANLPQKEIGKYIKILGEALQLSQPINSNSIAVHMPRFCNLLQLNKSAQELATHIGEVVMNKCFCTRRNPISISAAAIYLACQLEDRRKTQAEICKVTGLTEVTLRKVYKELLENWDDLLPSNYTPVVPPEKAFPTTTIASGRSTTPRPEPSETTTSDREKQPEIKQPKINHVSETTHQDRVKGENDGNVPKAPHTFFKHGIRLGSNVAKPSGESNQGVGLKSNSSVQESEQQFRPNPFVAAQVLGTTSSRRSPITSSSSPVVQNSQLGQFQTAPGSSEHEESSKHNHGRVSDTAGRR
ncbi:Plant-specific TFIIB-related protein 1 [Bienertia sinuspersici]